MKNLIERNKILYQHEMEDVPNTFWTKNYHRWVTALHVVRSEIAYQLWRNIIPHILCKHCRESYVLGCNIGGSILNDLNDPVILASHKDVISLGTLSNSMNASFQVFARPVQNVPVPPELREAMGKALGVDPASLTIEGTAVGDINQLPEQLRRLLFGEGNGE